MSWAVMSRGYGLIKERWIIIPRWPDFQHYKNRDPLWIKDYVKQLRNDEWMGLSLAQRGLLQGLRLLYAESNGVVSESGARRRLVGSESDARYWRVHLESLNHAGFIRFSASKPLALEKENKQTLSKGLSNGNGYVENLARYTGCVTVRGSHSVSHKYDPLGTERPPEGWPYPRPSKSEVAAALEARG